MQELQLYINSERVDLFKDEMINITQSIQNAKDPAKIFTDFTKSFTLPANKENNKIFQHYYNYDIVGGFDARLKVPAEIRLNYVTFRKGYLQLNGVDLQDNKANIYRVTFFGETVNLKDVIGEDNLSALTWLDNFVVQYDSATVKTYLQAGYDKTVSGVTYTDAIITPLITHSQRLIYDSSTGHTEGVSGNLYYHSGGANNHGVLWSELKYSIRLHLIIKAIEQEYGLSFSTDFFSTSNSNWHNLYMWMHRKKGNVESGLTGTLEEFTKIVDTFSTGSSSIPNITSNGTTITVYIFNPTTMDLDLTTASTDPYTVIINRNGVVYQEETNVVGSLNISFPTAINGNYTVTLRSAFSVSFSLISWSFTDGDITDDFSTSASVVIPAFFLFYPTQQLPEIKILDFLTGIFKIFNLTTYVDNEVIIVDTLDNFYSGGTSYDITEFVDVTKSTVDVALPYKQIDFEYEDYKTYLASIFNQLFAVNFGELKYKGLEVGNWVGDVYKITLPFQKMLYERLSDIDDNSLTTIQYGWMTDDNQQPYIGKPLIHYANLQSSSTTAISFRDDLSTHSSVSTYYIPTNTNGITTSVQSLHFGSEINEYTQEVNAESLYKNYYLGYIQDIFSSKKRLIKLTAYLPLRILLNYNLSDSFIINKKLFKINSIDTNLQTGESKLELLNEL